jgi:pSer/pThr/pTyr-binding forkhead associated (FHA) protein
VRRWSPSPPASRSATWVTGADLAYFTGASVDLVPGTRIELPSEGLVIGRSADAGLRVASSQVARAHVRVRPTPEGLQIEDLRSTNGTCVNGRSVETALLRAGDRLTLANGFDFDVIAI